MKILTSSNLLILCFLITFASCKRKANHEPVVIKEFNLVCDIELLDSIYANYQENIYIPIKFVTNNDTLPAKMRIRGDSSREYGKKSLKIVFSKDSIPAGEKRKINLNSEWTDKSYIRQYLSSRLMRDAGLACFNSNFAKVYLNGEYFGLYLQVENIDKAFLVRNELDKKGNLYKATKDGACLSSFDNIRVKWEKKSNKKAPWDDLQTLINEIDTINPVHFKHYLASKFEYDKLITIFAMNMLLQHGSTYYHNYYLYHDINGTNKWQMLPWDMDKTLSYYNWKPYKYHKTSSNWESDNPLVEKAFLNQDVFNDIQNKVEELGKTVFRNRIIDPIINDCEKLLQDAVKLDTTDQIEDVSVWKSELKKEKRFIANQLDYILNQLKTVPPSFQMERVADARYKNITLKWQPLNSTKNVKYKLLYGHHFLLENEETKIIENITDTSCYLANLKPGIYYWRVYANDGENEIEGFNTKSTFEILPEKKKYVKTDTTLTKAYSPHTISKTWVVNRDVTLTIEPGCKIILSECGTIENHGTILGEGSINDSIYFVPEKDNWDHITSYGDTKIEFDFCVFKDGFLRSHGADVQLNNCRYELNNKSLLVNGGRASFIWVGGGAFTVNNSYFKNYKYTTGEGINIHKAKVLISNSVFENMADAVELINVDDSEVSNNIIFRSPDDAIDLNGCNNIIIKNNIIINNKDKAISIGTEQYGPSNNILVENNLIMGNNIGISVKDSSFCKVINTTFANNNLAIEAKLKNNWKQYTVGGSANVENVIFYDNNQIQQSDQNSVIEINTSISNKEKLNGTNNSMEEMKFTEDFIIDFNGNKGVGAKIQANLIERLNTITH